MSNDLRKPWAGRFQANTHAFVEAFTASIDFDSLLGPIDAKCSIAHAKTLLQAEILTLEEFNAIESGLNQIITDIEAGSFEWKQELEDVHMNIESRLIELIGEPGRKLHTARSRNDQVASTFKVFLLDQSAKVAEAINELQLAILSLASGQTGTIMPGFTHMQSAQPVTFAHHLMAWFEMLERDVSRVKDWQDRTNVSPMGVAALAGTSYPIDRNVFAKEMGFDSITRNSLDTVGDRDFVIELVQVLSLISIHLSRMSEEIILWTSSAFEFIQLPDELCTGSSIMPQKKNPDLAELVRGKCGRVIGAQTALLVTMKGQPLAYNRDNQEDKEPAMDAVYTVLGCVQATTMLVSGMKPNRENMLTMARRGHPTATDMADWLVRKGVAFRDAHEITGKAVTLAIQQDQQLADLNLEQLKSLSECFDESIYSCLTIEGSVNSRSLEGGTAPETVKQAIEIAFAALQMRN